MFESSDYPKSLDEGLFDEWLEKGRASKIRYAYLLIVWDEYNSEYLPAYLENREEIHEYRMYASSLSQETLVAAYDLYSETRVHLSP